MTNKSLSRRTFLISAAATIASPVVLSGTVLGRDGAVPPSGKIIMAEIGSGNMGKVDIHSLLPFDEVRLVAVCDVVTEHATAAKKIIDGKYRNRDCRIYTDFREVLDRSDIDAVGIATPDHWHAYITIEACKKGKDVYCQKPESLTVREGRQMADAVAKYDRVFSGGSQRVIGDYADVPRLIRGGAIGQVKEVFASCGGPPGDCYLPEMKLPPGIDWDMWIGPAPWRPFHGNLIRGGFRPFRDYSGGGMTDWGAHRFGAVLFATDKQDTGPVEIIPNGPGDPTRKLTFRFADGMLLHHSSIPDINYIGTEGTLRCYNREIAVGKHRKPTEHVEIPGYKWFDPREQRGICGDFVYCVKTRQKPFRNIEASHRTACVCHLGNLAYRLNRPVEWDPEKEEIIGDPVASRLLDCPKRSPWGIEI